ncbi:MAG: FKBP-type peptidyl-prolyl cis-trans isomerase [Pseudomonadota bacterium]
MSIRSRLLAIVALVTIQVTAIPGAAAQSSPQLATDMQKLSYALAQRFAAQLIQQGLTDVDPDAIALGVMDAVAGTPSRVTPEEIQKAQEAVVAMLRKKAEEASRETLQAGLDFLAANKDKDGVVTLPSGVQYRILEVGDGKQPKATDQVTVHYRGTLLGGKEFDSSYGRGKPATFGLNQVIAGWTQVVSSIKAGTKVETWIPPDQGYGERGSPPTIPPNATLYFQIELLEVK